MPESAPAQLLRSGHKLAQKSGSLTFGKSVDVVLHREDTPEMLRLLVTKLEAAAS